MEGMTEYEKRMKEHEKIMKEENIRILRGITNCLDNIFSRQRTIDDPCLRSCLFVDKLSLSLDIAMGMLQAMSEEDVPLDLQQKILNNSKIIGEELTYLMQWVRSPTYSPDHPFGNNLVNNTSYYKNAEKNDEV